jgi:hypothetical protein
MPPGAAEWVVEVFELHLCPDPAVAAMAVAGTAAVVMEVATAAAVWASLSLFQFLDSEVAAYLDF